MQYPVARLTTPHRLVIRWQKQSIWLKVLVQVEASPYFGRCISPRRHFFLADHTASCHCSGYVAIGFSDAAGRMGPADAYVGWVDAGGVAQVVDFTTNSRSVNAPDPQQDASAVSGGTAGGVLTVTFTRKLDTKVRPQRPSATRRTGYDSDVKNK